ncbi:MAG: DUF4159 domain-containing protein [Gammaproteobacteria bacterium]|jgi:hypothetical protein
MLQRLVMAVLAGFAALALLRCDVVRGQVFAEGGMEAYESEFYFTRLAYDSGGYSRRAWRGAWTTDFPEAEIHLLQGINRLTRLATAREGRIVTLDDDELMNYPWLYAVEVGNWYLSDAQAGRLREYLDRGGFLMVDDFWGDYEWQVFHESLQRVFPDRPVVELPETHELLHVLYDLDQRVQIPGAYSAYRGITWEKGGTTPHWRGIFDDDGRLMVAINFNMDLGDAWEHADDPGYPQPMTALAYRFAVNYVIYTMTH